MKLAITYGSKIFGDISDARNFLLSFDGVDGLTAFLAKHYSGGWIVKWCVPRYGPGLGILEFV